ncbi:ommochrome-binding protein-like [Leguminivora glycinivorella]|uniref:ommochrome-binding protein-like n=1 Tax=Leguminivora glycinivorella TaxID=1035111 RepID=UPI002010573A|nr:ommochrome-binding protein-like [Leguminivora glycinivorella]
MDSTSTNSHEVMTSNLKQIINHKGKSFIREVLLADANVPYKLTVDRSKNKLFFCINADDFSDQSFHLVMLDLETGSPWVIPGIRNGFASAVDPATGIVYLGGSNGIFKYNYNTLAAQGPVLNRVDVFDMFFKNELYFVDTATQALSILRNCRKVLVKALKGYLIQHFVIDAKDDFYFTNSTGLYVINHGSQAATFIPYSDTMNFRGAAVDTEGRAHFITEDGVYQIDKNSNHLQKWLSVRNGYGIAFDKNNNIIYSDERSVNKIYPLETTNDPFSDDYN